LGSPLKALFALLVALALVVFVCTDVAYADDFEPPLEDPHFAPDPGPQPIRMDKPKAIMPEDPLELEQDDESEDDSKRQSGHKNPKNAPTAKREYHRKMMLR
jgi:hypothetical protein